MSAWDNAFRTNAEQNVRKQQGLDPAKTLAQNSKDSSYDYNGYIEALLAGHPRATPGINPSDGKMHYPDPFKTEDHPTLPWKSSEDYAVQARFPGMSEQAMRNGLGAAFGSTDPTYKRAIQMEQTVPMQGMLPNGQGNGDWNQRTQQAYTQYLFKLAQGIQ